MYLTTEFILVVIKKCIQNTIEEGGHDNLRFSLKEEA